MDLLSWSGLVASWLLLLLVAKYVFIVLRVLKQIRRLAEMSRDSAVALAANLADAASFSELELVAAQLPEAVSSLPAGADSGTLRMSSVSPGIGGRMP